MEGVHQCGVAVWRCGAWLDTRNACAQSPSVNTRSFTRRSRTSAASWPSTSQPRHRIMQRSGCLSVYIHVYTCICPFVSVCTCLRYVSTYLTNLHKYIKMNTNYVHHKHTQIPACRVLYRYTAYALCHGEDAQPQRSAFVRRRAHRLCA
jgi:hypothetical protein